MQTPAAPRALSRGDPDWSEWDSIPGHNHNETQRACSLKKFIFAVKPQCQLRLGSAHRFERAIRRSELESLSRRAATWEVASTDRFRATSRSNRSPCIHGVFGSCTRVIAGAYTPQKENEDDDQASVG